MSILRLIYSLLLTCLVPVLLLRLWIRSWALPAYKDRILERIGLISVPKDYQGALWFHAVSVGEVEAMIPIVRELKKLSPTRRLVFTTTTPTGFERLKLRLGSDICHFYLPFDAPWCVRLFLSRLRPSLWVLMESELWPNWLYYTSKRCAVILANARLSERSLARYRQYPMLAKSILEPVTAFLTQGSQEESLFKHLFPKKLVQHIGNTKWDCGISETDRQKGNEIKARLNKRPVWIAASTHAQEEDVVIAAHQQLLKTMPSLLLIVVPRHPDRFNEVAALLYASGLEISRRSLHDEILSTTQVYLADTMGELLALYCASDVAFVGGSFVPKGGHNMLEPLACSLYAIMGPNYSNFKEIGGSLINNELLKIVSSSNELANEVEEGLKKSNQESVASKACGIVEKNQGCSARYAKTILELVM